MFINCIYFIVIYDAILCWHYISRSLAIPITIKCSISRGKTIFVFSSRQLARQDLMPRVPKSMFGLNIICGPFMFEGVINRMWTLLVQSHSLCGASSDLTNGLAMISWSVSVDAQRRVFPQISDPEALAEALRCNQTLEELCLHEGPITDVGAEVPWPVCGQLCNFGLNGTWQMMGQ